MSTITPTSVPSLRDYVDDGLDRPDVDEAVFHPWLAEVLVHLPTLRDVPVDEVVEQVLEERRATEDPSYEGPEWLFTRWLAELVEGAVSVDEVLEVLPWVVANEARESAVAVARPWVLEVERRESWVCTATGEAGSGDVAVIRPRVEGHPEYCGEAVLSPAALGMALEELVRRETATITVLPAEDGGEPDRFLAYIAAAIEDNPAPEWMSREVEPVEAIQSATPAWLDVTGFEDLGELAALCTEVRAEALRLMGPLAEVLRRLEAAEQIRNAHWRQAGGKADGALEELAAACGWDAAFGMVEALRGMCNEVQSLGDIE